MLVGKRRLIPSDSYIVPIEFATSPTALERLRSDLLKAKLEIRWALITDQDGGSMMSNSDAIKFNLFTSKNIALAATEHLEQFQGGWGSRGRAHPVLFLTKDGKSGYIVPIQLYETADEVKVKEQIKQKRKRAA